MKILMTTQTVVSDKTVVSAALVKGEGEQEFSLKNNQTSQPQNMLEGRRILEDLKEHSISGLIEEWTEQSQELGEETEALATDEYNTAEPVNYSMNVSLLNSYSLTMGAGEIAEVRPISWSVQVSDVPDDSVPTLTNVRDTKIDSLPATMGKDVAMDNTNALLIKGRVNGVKEQKNEPSAEQGQIRFLTARSEQVSFLRPQPIALAQAGTVTANDNSLAQNSQITSLFQHFRMSPAAPQQSVDTAVASDNSVFRALMTNVTGNNDQVSQWKAEALGQNPVQWGQRLLSMLTDKVQLQVGQQIQKAHIRLDPPNLGTIEISISVEHDRTTVNLVASHQQVRDAMQQTIELLRLSLGAKLNTEVTVSAQGGHSEQKQGQGSASFKQDNIMASQWNEVSAETTLSSDEQPREWLNRLV